MSGLDKPGQALCTVPWSTEETISDLNPTRQMQEGSGRSGGCYGYRSNQSGGMCAFFA